MRFIDFSSWQGVLTTLGGLMLITLIGVGIRILMMLTLQQRQQRMNRQINERLKTLMSAYRVLGGSFTGQLLVDPAHMRDLKRRSDTDPLLTEAAEAPPMPPETVAERARRIRDAVEGALADILLLGTEDQVRLAATAAQDMAEGRQIHTAELVRSLRDYIRRALDLENIPADITIPAQGPTRPQTSGGKGGRGEGGGGGAGGGGGGGAGMGGGGGMGMGMGMGLGARRDTEG